MKGIFGPEKMKLELLDVIALTVTGAVPEEVRVTSLMTPDPILTVPKLMFVVLSVS